jgi:CTP:molybdopterin cytidylyltransferase MocA
VNPALVLLAAGASTRLGTCKALVDLGGRTPLERLLAAGACFDGAPPLVVTGAHHGEIARALPPGVEALRNPRWEDGRTGGVALAVRARAGLDLVIAPVDVPLVPAEVFEDLLDAWHDLADPAHTWLGPFVDLGRPGRPKPRFGHPVVVGGAVLSRLVDQEKDFPARPDANPIHTLRDLRLSAREVVSIGVENTAILDDLDTLADLARLRRRLS